MKRELKYVWWKRNYFPHIILERPRGKNEMCKENGITRADDQFYIVDKSLYTGKMYMYIGVVFLVFTSFGAFSRDAFEIPGVFFLILYSGICMANDIQIRRYSPSLTIDSELSYPIYLAVNTAVNKSYDIKQYNISVNKGWEEDGELYYVVGFIHKDYSENQRGGSRNFTIFVRRSDYRISFYLSR